MLSLLLGLLVLLLVLLLGLFLVLLLGLLLRVRSSEEHCNPTKYSENSGSAVRTLTVRGHPGPLQGFQETIEFAFKTGVAGVYGFQNDGSLVSKSVQSG